MRRTPLARTTGLRSGAQLASKGITRKPSKRLTTSRQAFYDVKPAVWTRDEGRCVHCGGRGAQHHHRQPRGMGGSSRSATIHSPAALIVLCMEHHDQVESERTWAEANGYLVRRGVSDPAEVPVNYRGSWALLSHDGGRLYVTEPTQP